MDSMSIMMILEKCSEPQLPAVRYSLFAEVMEHCHVFSTSKQVWELT
jgi:hypothetical protein